MSKFTVGKAAKADRTSMGSAFSMASMFETYTPTPDSDKRHGLESLTNSFVPCRRNAAAKSEARVSMFWLSGMLQARVERLMAAVRVSSSDRYHWTLVLKIVHAPPVHDTGLFGCSRRLR